MNNSGGCKLWIDKYIYILSIQCFRVEDNPCSAADCILINYPISYKVVYDLYYFFHFLSNIIITWSRSDSRLKHAGMTTYLCFCMCHYYLVQRAKSIKEVLFHNEWVNNIPSPLRITTEYEEHVSYYSHHMVCYFRTNSTLLRPSGMWLTLKPSSLQILSIRLLSDNTIP